MASIEKKVEFYSAGILLSGALYLPATEQQGGLYPGVILCNGFTSLKEMYLPAMAHAMTAEGFAALAFDYRGFGESAGVVGRLLPEEQVQDVQNAITFLQTCEEVDASRIAVCGTSFGGGIAISAGVADSRVRGVISSVPVCHGERWLRGMRSFWEWAQFRRRLESDRAQRVLTGKSERVHRDIIAPPDPAAKAAHGTSPSRPDLLLETADAIIEFNPEELIDQLAPRPLLMIVAEQDMRVPDEVSLPAFDRAREPKSLVILGGAAHHDVYKSPLQERVLDTMTAWLIRQLRENGT